MLLSVLRQKLVLGMRLVRNLQSLPEVSVIKAFEKIIILKAMKRNNLFLIVLMVASMHVFSQANLTIQNRSNRYVTVKIMKDLDKKSTLYKTGSVAPKDTLVIFLEEIGIYFTKSSAVLVSEDKAVANDTIFSKDEPFEIMVWKKGKGNHIIMEFKVEETKQPDKIHVPITREEYETD